jgi:hypothetical protein
MDVRTGLIWFSIGTGGGSCECGNEPWGSLQCREFIDYPRDCFGFKNNFGAWS